MTKITRIDPNGQSAQEMLNRALEDNPDQALVVWVKGGAIFVSAGGNNDRLWRMGALAAAIVEEWTHDS